MNADIFMQDLHAMIKASIQVQLIESKVVHADKHTLDSLLVVRDMHENAVRYQIDRLMRVAESHKTPIRYR